MKFNLQRILVFRTTKIEKFLYTRKWENQIISLFEFASGFVSRPSR